MRRLGTWLNRKFCQLLKVGVYTAADGNIVRARGIRAAERLPISSVKSWQVHPEMGFDVVVINLGSEECCWIDEYDDLISILRQFIPEKEISA